MDQDRTHDEERRDEGSEGRPSGGGGLSYTARPSEERPEEGDGATRDESAERPDHPDGRERT